MRSAAVTEWFKSIVALGDPYGDKYTDAAGVEHDIPSKYENYVKVDAANGQLTVSKADVLMFILDFVF